MMIDHAALSAHIGTWLTRLRGPVDHDAVNTAWRRCYRFCGDEYYQDAGDGGLAVPQITWVDSVAEGARVLGAIDAHNPPNGAFGGPTMNGVHAQIVNTMAVRVDEALHRAVPYGDLDVIHAYMYPRLTAAGIHVVRPYAPWIVTVAYARDVLRAQLDPELWERSRVWETAAACGWWWLREGHVVIVAPATAS